MPTPRGRLHWACMSGYFDSSNACAATGSVRAAARMMAPIRLRFGMTFLRSRTALRAERSPDRASAKSESILPRGKAAPRIARRAIQATAAANGDAERDDAGFELFVIEVTARLGLRA